MNWLITGGCGFIGTNLVRRLRAEGGNHIRIIDNLSVGTREDLASACRYSELVPDTCHTGIPVPDAETVQFVVGDIMDENLALAVVADMHVVVHLAANTGVGPSVDNPRLDCMMNVIGTFNYLEAARQARVGRFVFASSGAPAGEVTPPIHEEMPPHPVSPYGASKLAGEGYCSAYYRTYGLETVALRFGNVYGPGSAHKSSVVAKFLRDALATGVLRINGDGSQTRDFIYIDDLLESILAAACRPDVGGEVFQIATQSETTIGEIADQVCRLLEYKGMNRPTVVHDSPRLGDVKRNFSDTTKARERLGWHAAMTLEEGLGRTFDWFVSGGSHVPNAK